MNFFEVLTEKTLEREQDRVGRSVYLSAGVQRGIEATIEALKEMMAGEPVFINDVNEYDVLYQFFGQPVWLIAVKYEKKD